MDIFGRKWVSMSGLVINGVSTMLMPAFRVVVPWMYILRCLENVGKTPLMNSPLFLDYIKQKSMAEAGKWLSWTGTVAKIIAITGGMVLSTKVNVSYIFETFGALLIVAAVVVIFGIKDVEQESLKEDSQIPKSEKLKIAYKEFAKQIRVEKSIGTAMASSALADIQGIAIYQFGFLIYWTQYATDAQS